jgi:hypothetical protein
MIDQSSLERRLARQEAIQAIQTLKHAYLRACDGKDPEGVKDCFTVSSCEYEDSYILADGQWKMSRSRPGRS